MSTRRQWTKKEIEEYLREEAKRPVLRLPLPEPYEPRREQKEETPRGVFIIEIV